VSFDAGSIESRLTLDRSSFQRELDLVRREIEEFERRGINIKVGLDLTRFNADKHYIDTRLDELSRRRITPTVKIDTRGLDEATRKAQQDINRIPDATQRASARSNTQFSLLRFAIEQFGPALIPIAGGFAAAGSAAVGFGIVGVAALKGVQAELKTGTPLAQQYAGGITTVTSALSRIEHTAAQSTLGGFNSTIDTAMQRLPGFNGLLVQSGHILGTTVNSAVGGLLGGLGQATPLILDAERYIADLAGKFEAWANGPGGAKFFAALQQDFHMLIPLLSNFAGGAARALAGLNPLGQAQMQIFTNLTDILRHIPVSVVTTLTSAYVAFRAAVAITAGIEAARAALLGLAGAETKVAVGAGAAGAAQAGMIAKLGGVGAAALRFLGPVAATYAAATIGLGAAERATQGWVHSINTTKSFWGGLIASMKDSLTFNFGDIAKQAQDSADAGLRAAQNAADRRNLTIYYGTRFVSAPAQQNASIIASQQAAGLQALNPTQYRARLTSQMQAEGQQAQRLSQAYQSQKGVVDSLWSSYEGLRRSGLGNTLQARDLYNQWEHQVGVMNDLSARTMQATTAYQNSRTALQQYNAELERNRQIQQRVADHYVNQVRTANQYGYSQSVSSPTLTGAVSNLESYRQQLDKNTKAEQAWFRTSNDDVVPVTNKLSVSSRTWAIAMAQANGSQARAIGIIQGHARALVADQQAAHRATEGQDRINKAMGMAQVGLIRYTKGVGSSTNAMQLNQDQVVLYASALGITARQLANGSINAVQFVRSVDSVARFVNNANTATTGWIAAIQQFNSTADTAASRGQLMGAAMVALQGDTLSYANTMVQTSAANQQMVTDFGKLKAGVLDLKTGSIDYHNAGAAPVLADLQQMQTAAMNAAAATYQHEKELHGAKQAAADAADVFRNDTYGALVQQAHQLGLTHTQAKTLADTYFKWPKNARTQIEQLGGNQVQQTLSDILRDLDKMVGGHSFSVSYRDNGALTYLQRVGDQLRTIRNGATIGVTTYTPTGKVSAVASGSQAVFGTRHVPPNTVSTVGEAGYEALITDSRGRAEVLSNAQARRAGISPGGTIPGYALGTSPNGREHGGFTGVTGGGGGGGGGGGSHGGGGGGSSSSSHTRRHPSGPIADIVDVLSRAGFNDRAIAGILGNGEAESGLQQYRRQNTPSGTSYPLIVDGNTGWGIWQWTSAGYQRALMNRYGSYPTARQQAQYLVSLIGGMRGSLNNAPDAATAAARFMENFERPKASVANLSGRESAATSIFAQLSSGSIPSGGGGGLTSSQLAAQRRRARHQRYMQNHEFQVRGLYYQGAAAANQQRAQIQSRGNTNSIVQVGTGQYAGYGFNGQGYGSRYEALNARTLFDRQAAREERQMAREARHLDRQATSEYQGFNSRREQRRLRDDPASRLEARMNRIKATMDKASQDNFVPDGLVKRFRTDNKALDDALAYRDRWATKMSNRRKQYAQDLQASHQYQSSLRQGYMVDITSVGNGYAYGILASINQQTADSRKYKRLINRAKRMGLEPRIVMRFMNQPGGMANLEAIVDAGEGYVTQLNSAFDAMYGAANSIAAEGTHDKYGRLLHQDRRDIHEAMRNYNHGLREVQGELKVISRVVAQMRKDIRAHEEKKRKAGK
jgi:hypothetical protein